MTKQKMPYIPIIKWQQYEQHALRNLEAPVAARTLPCIEARVAAQQSNLSRNLPEHWKLPAIIDFANPDGLLSGTRPAKLKEFLRNARRVGWPVIPALNPEDPVVYATKGLLAQAAEQGEVALRLRLETYAISSSALVDCQKALTQLAMRGARVRMLVDFDETPEGYSASDLSDLGSSIRQLHAMSFSEMHFASGAFPSSLMSVKSGAKKFPRHDFELWAKLQATLKGVPIGFSDYGVLSPNWSEETLEYRSNSVALKYATDDHWLVLRTNGRTKEDLIALSEILVNNHGHIFKGEPYSYGDKLIADRANSAVKLKDKKCGHYNITDAWNHHITFVVKEQC